jgi:Flp pilus assembly protein TadG
MVMTAILMSGIVLAVGLCIDVARVYMVRTELQNAADAAALAAARELNSGAGGIQDAVTRATTIVNNYGFNRAAVTITNVEFAINLNDSYMSSASAQASPANIRFVRVTTQSAVTPMLFSARVLGTNHTESRTATAGMSVGINTICDFFPVAVALDPAVQSGDDESGYPAPNTTMTLNFVQGTGNSATLADKDYIILEVPDINGVGAPETVRLAGGVTSLCQTLNTTIPFHMTPSANQNNGPRDISDGVNTRFNLYSPGPGQINATDFPPDSNVRENITFDDYKNRTAVTAPNPNGPGKDDRRILIVPIVLPNTPANPVYSPPNATVVKFGAFFLKRIVTVQNPCSQAGNCAQLEVEWIDENLVLGAGGFTPGGGTSTLTIPVLYK